MGKKSKLRFQGVDKLIWEWIRNDLDTTKCEKCNVIFSFNEEYEIHHKIKYCDRPDLAMEKSNLVVLCKECHKKIHEEENNKKRKRKKRKKKKKNKS